MNRLNAALVIFLVTFSFTFCMFYFYGVVPGLLSLILLAVMRCWKL